jgi:pyruvate dehydrogenase E1 component alpha subunit
MFRVRRVEIHCDQEYKSRKIRGFCHLYDGQEAISAGTELALTREDDWITTYRCHGVAMARGCTPTQVFAEQFGYSSGTSRGKGGSMHMYRKEANFYGGAAIVGAHVPIAAGLSFYHRYKNTKNCSIVFYGDGSANQGQCWEACNMSKLWKLPTIFLIENNQYGMGTSSARSSALTDYYKQGGEIIPGIQINGMDALAVKTGILAAKEYVLSNNGPIFVEAKTYRYHGHSMSDPGITYRTRDEVAKTRAERDPIELVKLRLIESNFATIEELKETERKIRDEVQLALDEASNGKQPQGQELFKDIFTTGDQDVSEERFRMKSAMPTFIRMPDRLKSFHSG